MTLYPIFSRRIVRELEKQGFQVKKMAPNRQRPNLWVYYFEETPEFHNAAQKLFQKEQ